jgi:hypothetical protein
MVSISFDYLFNRVYDVLLWFKYTWVFTIGRTDVETYLDGIKNNPYDGLRDRGWFNDYFQNKIAEQAIVNTGSASDTVLNYHQSFLEKFANFFGMKLQDTDGDGIPNVSDAYPYDPSNLSSAQLKERFQTDYNWSDNLRDLLGIGPKDSDGDGVPDSFELTHGMNPDDIDSDHDGLIDGVELYKGTDPLDSDTDGDYILDGRDEMPLDSNISSINKDTDHDGVSDIIEHKLGTDINKIDTDGDGIPDGFDTFQLDSTNTTYTSPYTLDNLDAQTGHLSFTIQNPVLHFMTQFLSTIFVFILIFLMYVFIRWLIEYRKSLEEYDHHFHTKEEEKGMSYEEISEGTDKVAYPAGIAGLPIKEEDMIGLENLPQEVMNHPRWEIIQGYRNSDHDALWRIGIIEADNMLREVLQEKGYEGEDVADMLMKAKFNTVQLAWEAHKSRNKIAHQGSDYTLTDREAKKVFADYEAVFKELKAIL